MLLTPDRTSDSSSPFASVRGHINRTLAWTFPVAAIVLLLPVLLMEPGHKDTSPPNAWLVFAGPQSSQMRFEDAAPLEIHFELVRSWPDDEWTAEKSSQDDQPTYAPRISIYTILRWYDTPDTPPRRRPPPVGSLQYKIDPSFGFDNRELQLDGMMIRVWFDF